jgi:PAS domain-containing protein
MEIWVIWRPDYWLSGMVKAITALASVPTAILLVKLVPTALALPSPAILRDACAKLEQEIAGHCRTEERLRSADEQLRHDAIRGRLAAIVESSDDAIISIGRPTAMLFPADRAAEEIEILARVGRGERIASFKTIRVRSDGEHINVSATVSPIRDADGVIVGAPKIVRDITQQTRAENALIEQARILDLAQVAA